MSETSSETIESNASGGEGAPAPVALADLRSPRGLLLTTAWAGYLAASWTWCIGMFLPGILVRDYGLWGFVVFAVPNAIGAAAMGVVLTRRQTSLAMVRTHRPALLAFSIVTALFHLFWVAWYIMPAWLAWCVLPAGDALGLSDFVGRQVATLGTVFVLFVIVLATHFGRRRGGDALAGLAVWAASIALAWFALRSPTLPAHPPSFDATGSFLDRGLLWLAPAVVFGFAFCPYLDPTFHHAAQSCRRGSRAMAFGLGFCVMFLAMILFSLAYAPLQFDLLRPQSAMIGGPAWPRFLIAHLIVQATFTTFLHVEAIDRLLRRPNAEGAADVASDKRRRAPAVLAALVVVLVMNGSYLLALRPTVFPAGETIYLCFMGFYGLAFPAYVWMFMLGGGGVARQRQRRRWIAFAAALAIATPLFWLGFVEGRTAWIMPGVAVVLLSRLAASRPA